MGGSDGERVGGGGGGAREVRSDPSLDTTLACKYLPPVSFLLLRCKALPCHLVL